MTYRFVASGLSVAGIALAVACSGDDEEKNPAPTPNTTTDGGGGGGGVEAASAAGNACEKLCTDAKFTGGTLTVLGSGIAECQCIDTSPSGGLTEQQCDGFCAARGVPAAKAQISTADSPNDKCVCDGTS